MIYNKGFEIIIKVEQECEVSYKQNEKEKTIMINDRNICQTIETVDKPPKQMTKPPKQVKNHRSR